MGANMRDAGKTVEFLGKWFGFTRVSLRARAGIAGMSVALGLLATAPAGAAELQPLDPQPGSAELEAGLSVKYYFSFFREIDDLEWYMGKHEGQVGKPLPALNYRTAARSALTSGKTDGVGAEIEGLIHLAKTGTYAFSVRSNDGFVLDIDGKRILEDVDVHGDRYTKVKKLAIAQPGWYRLSVLYFERKGTSTLELYWRPPGDEDADMAIVPDAAFARLKAN
jgi:hypothetical protein